MKIVIISLGFGRDDNLGGSVRVASTNAIALAKLGHDVSYICTNRIDKKNKLYPKFYKETIDGVEVYFLNTFIFSWWPGDFGPHFSFIPEIVRRVIYDSDIVHLNEFRSYLSLSVSFIANARSIPIVVQPHGTFLNHGNRVVLKNLYNFIFNLFTSRVSKYFIASTSIEKKVFLDAGLDEQFIKIIPNGIKIVDTSQIKSGSFRNKYSINSSDLILLSIGRLDKLKGFQFVIESLVHLPSRIKYFIIGPDQQNYVSELNKILINLKLENKYNKETKEVNLNFWLLNLF